MRTYIPRIVSGQLAQPHIRSLALSFSGVGHRLAGNLEKGVVT
jgi:hypothetical protein